MLDEERNSASFDVLEMSKYLYGAEMLKKMDYFLDLVVNDPVFDRGDLYYMSREDSFERNLQKNRHMLNRIEELGLTDPREVALFTRYATSFRPMSELHNTMFATTLRSQLNDEQKEKWMPLVDNFKIFGTYAQTELAHGSNLKSIETTAVYDKENQEFVLNTPYLTSMKWWPGGLGKSTNHAVVMARLVIDGKDLGMNGFLVQTRSLEDHTTMPGIILGDIGPKLGQWSDFDNGRMELKNVRIPRENMLMKYAQVSPEGVYSQPPNSKLIYGTMIFIRAYITVDSATYLSRAITIATRYSCVRRQGYLLGKKTDLPEMKVMDYGSQQNALFPYLAASYALWFTSQYMTKLFYDLQGQLAQNDFSLLAEVHATSCALKAVTSWIALEGIEESRQRCGGHGFLRAAGLSDLYAIHLPAVTYEGDNLVLGQQTARYLMKCVKGALNGINIESNASYLNELATGENSVCKARTENDFLSASIQLDAFNALARVTVLDVYETNEQYLSQGYTSKESWNLIMPLFKELTETHSFVILVRCFIEAVENCKNESLRRVLKQLADLFALHNLQRLSKNLLMSGYLNKKQMKMIYANITNLLQLVRQNAVPLVDAWHHSDYILASSLGKYDGNVYESLYEESKKSVLNKTDVVKGYEKNIRPFIQKPNL